MSTSAVSAVSVDTRCIHYLVEPHRLHAHLYRVTLTLPAPAMGQVLALPVWIPGSYLVREFAQHLQHLRAQCGGVGVAVQQLDKHRWQVTGQLPADATPLQVTYEVYAHDASVRTAWLDAQRGFFNGTSVCLRVCGREDEVHELSISPPTDPTLPAGVPWQVATGLMPVEVDAQGFGRYCAASYAELVDSPVEMGAVWRGDVEVRGVPHCFVVRGALAGFDGERLLADTQRICEAEMAFWHGPDGAPPFARYVFMLNVTHDGYGGLEHHNSTALICPRSDLPQRRRDPHSPVPALKASDGYTRLLGLISHEYFHTWNVKRLRPAEFTRIDYDRENHTELLWFFEGFTSYYDDAFLLHTGLIDTATYLELVAQHIRQVAHSPGRWVQTVAQASFDAWTRYYRVQENTPNATVSYYTKGALVALCLDLTLHRHGTTLADTLRRLWQRCEGGPMTEADLRTVLREQTHGVGLDAELDAWVHSTAELPVLALLTEHGVQVQQDTAALAQRLGLRVSEGGKGVGVTVQNVWRDGWAERAGFAAGDEWLAVEDAAGHIWRIVQLADIATVVSATAQEVIAWVARDRQVLRLTLHWPGADAQEGGQTYQLRPAALDAPLPEAPARRWLHASNAR